MKEEVVGEAKTEPRTCGKDVKTSFCLAAVQDPTGGS